MRLRPLLLLPLLSLGVVDLPTAQAQPYPPPGYAPPPPPPRPYARQPATNGENCGTPDEPKPCPPLPRNPLPYYPANRQ